MPAPASRKHSEHCSLCNPDHVLLRGRSFCVALSPHEQHLLRAGSRSVPEKRVRDSCCRERQLADREPAAQESLLPVLAGRGCVCGSRIWPESMISSLSAFAAQGSTTVRVGVPGRQELSKIQEHSGLWQAFWLKSTLVFFVAHCTLLQRALQGAASQFQPLSLPEHAKGAHASQARGRLFPCGRLPVVLQHPARGYHGAKHAFVCTCIRFCTVQP